MAVAYPLAIRRIAAGRRALSPDLFCGRTQSGQPPERSRADELRTAVAGIPTDEIANAVPVTGFDARLR